MDLAPLLDLATLATRARHEQRATWIPGPTGTPIPEDVATHSMMLALVAAEILRHYNGPEYIDRNAVIRLALFHDLLEVYPGGPGDLNTYTATPTQIAEHKAAEAKTLHRLIAKFWWLGLTLEQAEDCDAPEAELVHLCDKMVPKLTLLLTGAYQHRDDPDWKAKFAAFTTQQQTDLAARCPRMWPTVAPFFAAAVEAVLALPDAGAADGGSP